MCAELYVCDVRIGEASKRVDDCVCTVAFHVYAWCKEIEVFVSALI